MKYKIKLFAGLVCPRRSLDYKKLENYFLINQCEIVEKVEDASHIILITCGFIDRNINESIELINVLKKFNKILIVGGCLKDIAEDILDENFHGKVFTTRTIDKITDFFPELPKNIFEIPDANFLHDYHEIDSIIGKRENIVEKFFFDKYKLHHWDKVFIIRIGYGCNCKCTYCSHRNAIGPYKSKNINECLNEFEKGYDQGYRIFKITSMDTGCYGLDQKSTLPDLINKFLNIHSDVEFVLEDINPVWINKYSEELIKLSKEKRIKALQCPIQSGSDKILKKMKRWSNIEKFLEIIKTIKNKNLDMILSTEVLVGFPGETEEDFNKTLLFLKEAHFDFIYIYPYYENDYMESKNIFPKCKNENINNRINLAINFFNENKISYNIFLCNDN